MHIADCAVARFLSVHLSHAGILSKRLNIPSKFFHHRVARLFWVSAPNVMTLFRRGPPKRGCRMQSGMKKITIIDPISRFMCEMMQDTVTVTLNDSYRRFQVHAIL